MNVRRTVALATVIAVALMIAILWSPADRAPLDDAKDARLRAARTEVAYPPALPDADPLAAPPAEEPLDTKLTDLCGYGKVDPEQIPVALQGAADSVLLKALDEFGGARDPRKRALGLATRAWIDAEAADRRVMALDPQACVETGVCDEQAAEAIARGAAPSIEALARAAITTQDPNVYVMAMRACRSITPDEPPSMCGALTLDEWARLDPDNAMPWLLSARAAKQRMDDASFRDALQRASRSRFFDRRRTPYGEVLADVDEHTEPLRTLIVGRLADADAHEDPADYQSNFTVVFKYCQQPGDAERRAMCSDIGHVLNELSTDALALQIGDTIGDAFTAGWPAERIAAVRKRRAGLELPNSGAIPPTPLGCSDAARAEARLIGVARYGELDYARQRAAAGSPR